MDILLNENINEIGIGVVLRRNEFYITILINDKYECNNENCI